jgi:hypothetical protein
MIDGSRVQEVAEPAKARESLIGELVVGKTNLLERLIELLGALARRPEELEIWKHPAEFAKICPISSVIRVGLGVHRQLAARYSLGHNLRQLPDLVV